MFVHKYEMAGRVLEESNESFNTVLAKVNKMVACMPGTVSRVGLINNQTQGNLKSEIMEPKLVVMDAIEGKE